MQNKKYWRWNLPNWLILWVVEADQRNVKYATECQFLDFLQFFDRLLRLTEWTNLDDSNAIIFLFCIQFLLPKNFLDLTIQRWGCHKNYVNDLRKWWIVMSIVPLIYHFPSTRLGKTANAFPAYFHGDMQVNDTIFNARTRRVRKWINGCVYFTNRFPPSANLKLANDKVTMSVYFYSKS
jgi:hypothetical protein